MIELYDWQQRDVTKVRRAGYRALLAIEPGGGKGHPLDEPVLTPTGWVLVGDLEPGDFVVGSDGGPTEVLDVYDRGVLPVYRVTFRDGSSVRVDGDHLWQVTSGKSVTVKDTRTIASWGSRKQSKYRIPVTSVEFPEADLPVDPYLLGGLIADGYLTGTSIQWTKNDPAVIEEMRAACDRDGSQFRSAKYGPTTQHLITNNGLVGRIRELGLNVKSGEKFIPEMYLTASKRQRLELVNGLFDGDGSVRKERGTARYSTVSGQLADDVLQLLWSLGVGATKELKKHPRGDYWNVVVHGDFNPFRVHPDKGLVTGSKRNLRRSFKSIEYVGDELVRCIRVAAEDSLYVTKDFIVTHNTILSTAMVLDAVRTGFIPADPVVLIIAPQSTHLSAWNKTMIEFGMDPIRVVGNGNKAGKAALADLEWGVAGWYVVTPQLFTRNKVFETVEVDAVIVDECFVAGTKVSTPQGPRNIEDLKVGDEVYGYDHETNSVVVTRVRDTMVRATDTVLPNGSTPNHPYYVEGYGYRPVADITEGDYVYTLDEQNLRIVRKRVRGVQEAPEHPDVRSSVRESSAKKAAGRTHVPAVRGRVQPEKPEQEPEVLFPWVQGRVGQEPGHTRVPGVRRNLLGYPVNNQQDVRAFMWPQVTPPRNGVDTDEGVRGVRVGDDQEWIKENMFRGLQEAALQQEHGTTPRDASRSSAGTVEEPGVSSIERCVHEQRSEPGKEPGRDEEGAGYQEAERGWVQPPNRWERDCFSSGAEALGQLGVILGVQSRGYHGSEAWFWIPVPLQDRRGEPRIDGWSGSGWSQSQESEVSGAGCEEGCASHEDGVDYLEIREPRDFERYAAVSRHYQQRSEVEVYNIETGTGNYFADTVLVHNCHILSRPGAAGQKKLSGYTVRESEKSLAARSKMRLALSGTPARNKFELLWGVTRFLWPELDGIMEVAATPFSQWQRDRMDSVYSPFTQSGREYTGESTPGLLMKSMPCVIQHYRRTRCCAAHPKGFMPLDEPVVVNETLTLTAKQKQVITQLEEDAVAWLEDNPLVAALPIVKIARIRQATLAEVSVEEYVDGDLEVKQRVWIEDNAKSPFADRVEEILDSLGDEPVLVLTSSKVFAKYLVQRLDKRGDLVRELSGDTRKTRDADVAEFGDEYRVAVAVIDAIGTGTDGLGKRCSTEIWVDTSLDSTNNSQAAARLDRMGQERRVHRTMLADDMGYAGRRWTQQELAKNALDKSIVMG